MLRMTNDSGVLIQKTGFIDHSIPYFSDTNLGKKEISSKIKQLFIQPHAAIPDAMILQHTKDEFWTDICWFHVVGEFKAGWPR